MKYLLLIGLCIGFVLGTALIPAIIAVSFRKGFLDKPNARKIHTSDIPRLGGTCFFPVCLVVGALMVSLGYRITTEHILQLFHYSGIPILYGMVGAMVLFCFGLLDDIWGLRYRTKFIAQIMAGLLLCVGGVWLKDLHGLFGLHELPIWVGWPVTIFAIVFVTNAINFIDGIDGLASSVCFFTLAYFALLFYRLEAYDYAIVSVTVMGPLLAFMCFNLLGSARRHTKTFMGDTGSLFLGYVICILGIVVSRKVGVEESNLSQFNPMAVAFAPLILPCFDVMRVVLVRKRQGNNPFIADKNHIHHKFLSLGLNQHVVLVIVLLLTAAYAVMTVLLTRVMNVNVVLLLMLVLWTLMNFALKNNNKPSNTDNKKRRKKI